MPKWSISLRKLNDFVNSMDPEALRLVAVSVKIAIAASLAWALWTVLSKLYKWISTPRTYT